jgi:selenium metabolism protein YedF
MKPINVRNLACPGPVLKLRELLDSGELSLCLHVADELSRTNVSRFAESRGAAVEIDDPGDGSFLVRITAAEESRVARSGEEELINCDLPGTGGGRRVVQVTGNTMGTGNDELGQLLLRSFLKTQVQLEHRPEAVIFYNDGVKLCCEGSLVLDDLQTMESEGIEIVACGTCLNFFELADRLMVGRVTDMLEIATILSEAGRVVRP